MFKAKTFVLSNVFALFVIASFQTVAMIGTEMDKSSIGIEDNNIDISESSLYTLSPPYHHPSPLSFKNELSPVWIEFIHGLDNEFKQKNFAQICIDPNFAFRFELLSQCVNGLSFDDVQISGSSDIMVLSVKVNDGLVKASNGVNFCDISSDSTKSIESWNTVFYYPRKFKKIISYKGEKKSPVRPTVPPDEEDTIFDILQFFKRWGTPKPLTVALLAVAAYLILAFLARK